MAAQQAIKTKITPRKTYLEIRNVGVKFVKTSRLGVSKWEVPYILQDKHFNQQSNGLYTWELYVKDRPLFPWIEWADKPGDELEKLSIIHLHPNILEKYLRHFLFCVVCE